MKIEIEIKDGPVREVKVGDYFCFTNKNDGPSFGARSVWRVCKSGAGFILRCPFLWVDPICEAESVCQGRNGVFETIEQLMGSNPGGELIKSMSVSVEL